MRKPLILVTVVMMLVALASVTFAASPSQLECEAAGGTFDRSQGQVTCIYPPVEDPVGNSENSNGHSQTTTTTAEESSNGTLNNKPKHQESSECDGPGNGGSDAQCP